jgi:hypothetical protein
MYVTTNHMTPPECSIKSIFALPKPCRSFIQSAHGFGFIYISSMVRGVVAGEWLEVATIEGRLGDNCGDGKEDVGGEDEAKTDD